MTLIEIKSTMQDATYVPQFLLCDLEAYRPLVEGAMQTFAVEGEICALTLYKGFSGELVSKIDASGEEGEAVFTDEEGNRYAKFYGHTWSFSHIRIEKEAEVGAVKVSVILIDGAEGRPAESVAEFFMRQERGSPCSDEGGGLKKFELSFSGDLPLPDFYVCKPGDYCRSAFAALQVFAMSEHISEVVLRDCSHGMLLFERNDGDAAEDVVFTDEGGVEYVDWRSYAPWHFSRTVISRPHMGVMSVRALWYDDKSSDECWADIELSVTDVVECGKMATTSLAEFIAGHAIGAARRAIENGRTVGSLCAEGIAREAVQAWGENGAAYKSLAEAAGVAPESVRQAQAAMQFVRHVADCKMWGFDADDGSRYAECHEPDEGHTDSHNCLMGLIEQARALRVPA